MRAVFSTASANYQRLRVSTEPYFSNREEIVTAGQRLTLMGDREAVYEAVELLSGEGALASA